MNVGVEIFGKGNLFTRPVLILKKFGDASFFGIPLTSNKKEGTWYVPITCAGVEGSAVLNQAKTFDAKRLTERIEALSDDNFQKIKQSFLGLLAS